MSKEIMTLKEIMEDENLAKFIAEDIDDLPEDSEVTYEVWTTGVSETGFVDGTELLMGTYADPDEAVMVATALTVSDIVNKAAEENNGENPEEDIECITVEVETVIPNEEGDGTMNIGTIYKRDLWLDGEYGCEEDFMVPEVSEPEEEAVRTVCITENEYELLEDGNLKVARSILEDYDVNDTVQFLFVEEDSDRTPILSYKVISRVFEDHGEYYICEFVC